MHCITAIRLFPCAHVQGEFGDQIRSAGGGGCGGGGGGGSQISSSKYNHCTKPGKDQKLGQRIVNTVPR